MEKIRIAALLTLLLLINLAFSGCIFPEEEKERPVIELQKVGKSHKIYAGDSTTYVIIVKNHRDENENITLSITSEPSGWEATLNQTVIDMTDRKTMGVFLVVNSSSEAKNDDYKVKIKAVTDFDGAKDSLSITTTVIGEKGNIVREGDKVEVDYLGYLEDYVVFDTTIRDIGKNNAIRKTSDFNPNKAYDSFKIYVSANDPDPTDEYGSSVEGFWEAVVGMRVGQSRTVLIPPSKAYGVYDNATVNVTEEVTIIETITYSEFLENYQGTIPKENMVMSHHFWKWNITLDYVNESEDIIRITNEPYLNQEISPYGWESEVIYKNQSDNDGEGRILVKHDAESGMEAVYQGYEGVVMSVDDDEIILRYNHSGHTLGHENLIFDIKLLDIVD